MIKDYNIDVLLHKHNKIKVLDFLNETTFPQVMCTK